MLTVATWNMAKRVKAAGRLPELLDRYEVDILFVQEAPTADRPAGYVSLHAPYARPDAIILVRSDLSATLVSEPPLSVFERFAAVGTVVVDDVEFEVASVHPIAQEADASYYEGFDPDDIRREGVERPWENDVAFARLVPFFLGRRFLVGADLNTSRLFEGGPAFLDRAASAGWVDLVHRAKGEQVPTFLTGRSSTHQLDYLFADEQTAEGLVSVVVDTSVTDRDGDWTSDHALVVSVLDLSGSSAAHQGDTQ